MWMRSNPAHVIVKLLLGALLAGLLLAVAAIAASAQGALLLAIMGAVVAIGLVCIRDWRLTGVGMFLTMAVLVVWLMTHWSGE